MLRRLARALVPGRRFAMVIATVALARAGLALYPRPPLSSFFPGSTSVTAGDGTMLRLTLAADGSYRLWTRLDELSPLLIEATLLYEDRHFHRHLGVNPVALARAGAATYLGGGRRIGGSTITMQLARRLWGLPSHTLWGKARQIARALELEARYSKREILEAYLNLAPYGGNVEGAGAASEIYFRKRPAALTLGEALTLAVIPQSPSRRARQRRGGEGGADAEPILDQARGALARRWAAAHRQKDGAGGGGSSGEAVVTWPRLRAPEDLPFRAPHFVDQVLAEAAAGAAASTGGRAVTTLDLRWQRLLERHVRGYVARQRERGIENAAAMLVDMRDGGVRALVGSADFFDARISGQVNGALARRSPGSTLKPFAYGLALDQGVIHPATMLRDVPTSFAAYSPENFDGRFAGPLSAKDALIRSRNVPALAVASRLERPDLYELLESAGVTLPHPAAHYGLGIVLGTAEVTMQDLVRLYAALGNGGLLRPLRFRAGSREGSGKDGAAAAARAGHGEAGAGGARGEGGDDHGGGVRILSPESAFLIRAMLEDNPRPGASLIERAAPRPLPVAWKTGTSWRYRDAWTVGLVGSYVLAVWIGDFSGAGNPAYVGLTAAAPLFFQIVDSLALAEPGLGGEPRPAPPGLARVEICALSGGLPTAACAHRRRSWFIPGRSPVEPCTIHRSFEMDARGRRTCAAGPPAARTETFEVWPSDLARLFAAAGLPRRPLPPAAPDCGDPAAPRGASPRITSPLAGVTYAVRPGAAERDTLALQSVVDGDAAETFWFVDDAFVGRAPRGETLFWRPDRGGRFTVRVLDDLGRADARTVAVEVAR